MKTLIKYLVGELMVISGFVFIFYSLWLRSLEYFSIGLFLLVILGLFFYIDWRREY